MQAANTTSVRYTAGIVSRSARPITPVPMTAIGRSETVARKRTEGLLYFA